MVAPIDDNLDKPVVLVVVRLDSTTSLTLSKHDLQTILQRALNTWSDVPPALLDFSDAIDKI